MLSAGQISVAVTISIDYRVYCCISVILNCHCLVVQTKPSLKFCLQKVHTGVMRWFLVRYLVASLSFFCFLIAYNLRVSLSIAIVGMVNYTAISDAQEATTDATVSPQKVDGPFVWSPMMQGVALSSYYWGYLISQFPGGRIAEVYSCKWVMFFAIAVNVACAVLTPAMAYLHFAGVLIVRIVQGIGGGVTFPASHVVLAHWAPWEERSIMSSIVYSGTSLGTASCVLFSGLILGYLSWEWVFYIEGGLSALWLIAWFFLMSEYPDGHPCISEEERDYIMQSVSKSGGEHKEKFPIPWKKIWTSPPFWAILVAHAAGGWGFYMILIEIPFYMEAVLNFQVNENAFLATFPFFTHWAYSVGIGKSMDYLRVKNIISTTFARKFCTFASLGVSTICFLVLCFVGRNQTTLAYILMLIAITSYGAVWPGYVSNHIDIAPNLAGTLMALTDVFATMIGILVPLVVGKLLDNDPGIGTWRMIFFGSIACQVFALTVYGTCASGEVQSWNEPVPST